VLFEDIREGARALFHIADVEYGRFIHAGFAALAAFGFLAVAAYFLFLARRPSEPAGGKVPDDARRPAHRGR
jgi:hypothetical protein